jgi:hypothetical protein
MGMKKMTKRMKTRRSEMVTKMRNGKTKRIKTKWGKKM